MNLRTLVWSLGLLLSISCGSRINNPSFDSQTHWLKPCESDRQCGELSCLCGVCSTSCETALDCVAGARSGECAPAEIAGPGCSLPAQERICVPQCSGSDCVVTASERPSETRPPAAEPVPACPEPAATTSLPPLFFTTDIASYSGIATVNQRTQTGEIVLALNELAGGLVELRFNTRLPDSLPIGLRVQAEVRSGGTGSERYFLIALRDDAGALLLLSYSGGDGLYQEGMFASGDAFGFALELKMTCQSAQGDACFEDQVQAMYSGTFTSEDQLTTYGGTTPEFNIGGRPFDVTFWSSSVDGGARRTGCGPEITRGRHLLISLLRSEG